MLKFKQQKNWAKEEEGGEKKNHQNEAFECNHRMENFHLQWKCVESVCRLLFSPIIQNLVIFRIISHWHRDAHTNRHINQCKSDIMCALSKKYHCALAKSNLSHLHSLFRSCSLRQQSISLSLITLLDVDVGGNSNEIFFFFLERMGLWICKIRVKYKETSEPISLPRILLEKRRKVRCIVYQLK